MIKKLKNWFYKIWKNWVINNLIKLFIIIKKLIVNLLNHYKKFILNYYKKIFIVFNNNLINLKKTKFWMGVRWYLNKFYYSEFYNKNKNIILNFLIIKILIIIISWIYKWLLTIFKWIWKQLKIYIPWIFKELKEFLIACLFRLKDYKKLSTYLKFKREWIKDKQHIKQYFILRVYYKNYFKVFKWLILILFFPYIVVIWILIHSYKYLIKYLFYIIDIIIIDIIKLNIISIIYKYLRLFLYFLLFDLWFYYFVYVFHWFRTRLTGPYLLYLFTISFVYIVKKIMNFLGGPVYRILRRIWRALLWYSWLIPMLIYEKFRQFRRFWWSLPRRRRKLKRKLKFKWWIFKYRFKVTWKWRIYIFFSFYIKHILWIYPRMLYYTIFYKWPHLISYYKKHKWPFLIKYYKFKIVLLITIEYPRICEFLYWWFRIGGPYELKIILFYLGPYYLTYIKVLLKAYILDDYLLLKYYWNEYILDFFSEFYYLNEIKDFFNVIIHNVYICYCYFWNSIYGIYFWIIFYVKKLIYNVKYWYLYQYQYYLKCNKYIIQIIIWVLKEDLYFGRCLIAYWFKKLYYLLYCYKCILLYNIKYGILYKFKFKCIYYINIFCMFIYILFKYLYKYCLKKNTYYDLIKSDYFISHFIYYEFIKYHHFLDL